MVMTDLYQDEQTKFPEFGSERLVGWYSEFEKAYSAVTENACDINECCYDYALIEGCEEGLYQPAMERYFFKFDNKERKYVPIPEPDFVKKVCGFTIG